MESHKIMPLTEGGLLAALTVVIALMSVYLPFVGPFVALLWPLPLAVLVLRHGLRQGVMAMLVSGAALSMLIEPLIALRLTLSYGPLGLVLGFCYHKKYSGSRTFLLSLTAAILGELAVLGLLFAVLDANPFAMMLDGLKQSFDASISIYDQAGMEEQQLEEIKTQISTMMQVMSQLGPLLIALLGVLDTAVAYAVGRRVAGRLGHETPPLPPFAEWRLPKGFVYLALSAVHQRPYAGAVCRADSGPGADVHGDGQVQGDGLLALAFLYFGAYQRTFYAGTCLYRAF